MSLLSAKGIVRGGHVKTAFSISDIADSIATLPDSSRSAYYSMKDLTYPMRSALRISDYNDRIADKLAKLEALSNIGAVKFNRALDNYVVSPLMNLDRF